MAIVAFIVFVLLGLVSLTLAALYARYRMWLAEYRTRYASFLGGNFPKFLEAMNNNTVLEYELEDVQTTTQLIMPLGLGRIVLCADADWTEYITTTKNLPKSRMLYENLKLFPEIKQNLILECNNEAWRNLRRPLCPLLVVSEILSKGVQRWFHLLDKIAEDGGDIDLDEDMVMLTFDFISEAAFGIEFNSLEDRNGEQAELLKMLTRILHHLKFPNEGERQFKKDRVDIREICDRFAAEANQGNDGKKAEVTIWQIVNSMKDFSDLDRFGHFVLFVIAGHDTTAHGVSFTMALLLSNPECLKKAVAEVDRVLRSEQSIAEFSQIPDLAYITQCFKEALRMYPPGGGASTTREMDETKTINGVTIKKGESVMIDTYKLHYNPNYFPEPMKFNPDRWSKENEGTIPKCAFFAFSQGPRDCIGKTLALNEGAMVIASLLKNYKFELKDCFKLVMESAISNRPFKGLPLKIHKRK